MHLEDLEVGKPRKSQDPKMSRCHKSHPCRKHIFELPPNWKMARGPWLLVSRRIQNSAIFIMLLVEIHKLRTSKNNKCRNRLGSRQSCNYKAQQLSADVSCIWVSFHPSKQTCTLLMGI
jgi:hypothetical protein